MTADPEPTPLPPIRTGVRVRRAQAEAFRLFTQHMGSWWPVDTHRARGPVSEVVFEGREGGRIYERCEDGVDAEWGEVLVWEPPSRVVFSWHPGADWPASTEVEVRFQPLDDGTTRVDVEHRDWQRLGPWGPTQHGCHASPNGWTYVLARYQASVEGARVLPYVGAPIRPE
jgi:uncharacterized protein YndB with AHSA1/START domain